MLLDHDGLVMRMTSHTGKDHVVRRIRVAIGAGGRAAMSPWEPGVIERRAGPRRGGVAGLAGGGKAGGGVIGIGGGAVFRFVAGIAVRRNGGVVVVDVAVGAGDCDVLTRQGKSRLAVVKRGWLPGRGGVAQLALLRESRRDVVRVCRGLVILQMAGGASHAGQVVIAVDVARRAGDADMRAGQREARRRVVELGTCPGSRRVADRAICGEADLRVVGIRRPLIILQVTRRAGRAGQIVVAVDVASRARNVYVRTG